MRTDQRALLGKAALLGDGTAHELAELGSFPTSARASFVTGAMIPIDGGCTAKLA